MALVLVASSIDGIAVVIKTSDGGTIVFGMARITVTYPTRI